jgi:ATP-binding cassette subfamily C (CFTR/MRP) protein 1
VGTYRFNLDPDDEMNDSSILEVLKMVGVWSHVEKGEGLGADMKSEELSHGERQLFSVSRAILRRRALNGRCLLILDEATSNLDKATGKLVHGLISKEFAENTVITVSHGSEVLRGADFIIELEDGAILSRNR